MYNILGSYIRMKKGDSFSCSIDVCLKMNQKFSADDEICFIARNGDTSPDLINKKIPLETMWLQLEPDDTKKLSAGTYSYAVKIFFANGAVDTIARGTMKILPEV